MSTTTMLQSNWNDQPIVQHDSLLESLYTNYGLSQLQGLLYVQPERVFLQAWNISVAEYRSLVLSAINLVEND